MNFGQQSGQVEKVGGEYKHLENSQKKPWVKKVNRLILMAGMNRGWSSTPASRLLKLFYDLEVILDTLFAPITQNLFIFKVRRYSRFITKLRHDWMLMSNYIEYQKDKLTEEKDKLTLALLILEPQNNAFFSFSTKLQRNLSWQIANLDSKIANLDSKIANLDSKIARMKNQ